jgi:outer membrane immunogenic protein
MSIKTAIAAAAALIATSTFASAADMAVKARPAPIPVEVWNWTGFYIGAHVGAGWGETESTLTGISAAGLGAAAFTLPFSQTSYSGFLGGGQVGVNWQTGWAVLGVQGDFAGADIKGTSPCFVVLGCTTKTDWLATVSGRIGAVVLDRGLVYAKGGVAWMNSTHSVAAPNFGGGIGVVGNITSKEVTHFGWLLGLGTEWMITRNWTAFVEYNYIEFDKTNQAFLVNLGAPIPAFTVNADLKNTLSIAKVGVNYKFDWGGPVAGRY